MINSLFNGADIRLLPYPDGKAFAFTIIDDTDGSSLESARPIYEFLFSLGLRTTKTVWVNAPKTSPATEADRGDTLERQEYAEYVRLLRRRGFEIALHNISSQSSSRSDIAAGLERFTYVVGEQPKINVHHEKNRENLYFEFAQSGRHLPPPFRSATFQRLHKLLKRNNGRVSPSNHGCAGENCNSEYFWGDICKAKIKFVRSNVFFQDLNTLKCSPRMPYVSAETPYVNYWFDSSNGQDARCFNSILSDRNIDRLRKERGCSVLYTHFGKGFVTREEGKFELNRVTKERLRAISGHAVGWYIPVSTLLDRLLAFQLVVLLPLHGGIAIANQNSFDIPSVTLQTAPGKTYYGTDGEQFTADRSGRIILPSLPAGRFTALLRSTSAGQIRRWNEEQSPAWLLDMEKIRQKFSARF